MTVGRHTNGGVLVVGTIVSSPCSPRCRQNSAVVSSTIASSRNLIDVGTHWFTHTRSRHDNELESIYHSPSSPSRGIFSVFCGAANTMSATLAAPLTAEDFWRSRRRVLDMGTWIFMTIRKLLPSVFFYLKRAESVRASSSSNNAWSWPHNGERERTIDPPKPMPTN